MFLGAAMTPIETVTFSASDYSISNYSFSLSLLYSRGETKKLQNSIFYNRNVRAVTVPNPWNFRSKSHGVLRVRYMTISYQANTSLAVLGALAHRLQRRTACNTAPPATPHRSTCLVAVFFFTHLGYNRITFRRSRNRNWIYYYLIPVLLTGTGNRHGKSGSGRNISNFEVNLCFSCKAPAYYIQ